MFSYYTALDHKKTGDLFLGKPDGLLFKLNLKLNRLVFCPVNNYFPS